jgi:hypothetical protein
LALHVFSIGAADHVLELATWNAASRGGWSSATCAEGCLFFAEDAFGFQFCLKGNEVCSFDAETGKAEFLAASLEEWAARLLIDFRYLTGHPIAHDWQSTHGPLVPGQRLAPKTPFVLGGEFATTNLYAADQVQLMRLRGRLATQIRDVPDGTQVTLKVTR